MISRFQRYLRKRLPRLFIGGYKPLKRPSFVVDDELEIRRAVARDLMGDTQVKPVLGPKLIEEQPDYGDLELRRPIG